MKIRTKERAYDEVAAIEPPKHKTPGRQSALFRLIMRVASIPDLWATKFRARKIGMEKLGRREPCLVLMNHSSFIDLEIAATLLFPRPYHIVCTSDGVVGKPFLMRLLGCIPTKKFVFELGLVRDITHAVREKKSSVLLYPEASYSFDRTATPLPETVGQLAKRLGVPVVMIKTYGAFTRQPLYNGLRKRKVRVSADMIYLLSPEELASKSADEIMEVINAQFDYDHFRWQQENRVRVDNPDRAEDLHRVLYKCPACLAEGKTEGHGELLTCHACKKSYRLDEYGYLAAIEGKTEFPHIPDWYAWERESVRREILDGSYRLDCAVDIAMMVDTKCIYRVGEGRLVHTAEGFCLTGCDGKLSYEQKAVATYSLYADYYWYELGDVICIGNHKALYYCFPKDTDIPVAKARLATEEIYRLIKREKLSNPPKQPI